MKNNKKSFIIYSISIIVLAILGILIGIYMYKIKETLDMPILDGMENRNLKDEIALLTTEKEEIISPNAMLIIKNIYQKCGHEKEEKIKVDNKYVNLNKDEFEKEFLKDNENFIIKNFSPKEIIVIKEIDKICDEHYLLKTNSGVITIYKYDIDGNEVEYKRTNIGLEYLTENDKIELEKGIEVIGESELNSRLEDYV